MFTSSQSVHSLQLIRMIRVFRRFTFLVILMVIGAGLLVFHEYLFAMSGTPSASCTSSPPLPIDSWLQSGSDLRMAFVATPGDNQEIFTMNLTPQSGGGFTTDVPINISNSSSDDRNPAWSPDGTQIAFQTRRDGNDEVYVMQSDGSKQTRITTDPSDDGWPSWSPDGKQIAFSSRRDGNWEIYIMDADGKNIRRKTNSSYTDAYPRWSPNGEKIAFSSNRDGNWEIYTMNAAGGMETGVVRLTNSDTYHDIRPTWSADSTRLIFTSTLDDLSLRDSRLVEIQAETGAFVRNWQRSSAGTYREPSWSRNGKYLAYVFSNDNNIYGINIAQLGTPVVLTTHQSVMGKMNAEVSLWSPPLPGKLVFLPIITRGDPPYYCPQLTPSPTRETN